MEKVVRSMCYQIELEIQIEMYLHACYNLQDFSSQGIINTVIRRLKNGGVKSVGKSKTFGINQGSSPD